MLNVNILKVFFLFLYYIIYHNIIIEHINNNHNKLYANKAKKSIQELNFEWPCSKHWRGVASYNNQFRPLL